MKNNKFFIYVAIPVLLCASLTAFATGGTDPYDLDECGPFKNSDYLKNKYGFTCNNPTSCGKLSMLNFDASSTLKELKDSLKFYFLYDTPAYVQKWLYCQDSDWYPPSPFDENEIGQSIANGPPETGWNLVSGLLAETTAKNCLTGKPVWPIGIRYKINPSGEKIFKLQNTLKIEFSYFGSGWTAECPVSGVTLDSKQPTINSISGMGPWGDKPAVVFQKGNDYSNEDGCGLIFPAFGGNYILTGLKVEGFKKGICIQGSGEYKTPGSLAGGFKDTIITTVVLENVLLEDNDVGVDINGYNCNSCARVVIANSTFSGNTTAIQSSGGARVISKDNKIETNATALVKNGGQLALIGGEFNDIPMESLLVIPGNNAPPKIEIVSGNNTTGYTAKLTFKPSNADHYTTHFYPFTGDKKKSIGSAVEFPASKVSVDGSGMGTVNIELPKALTNAVTLVVTVTPGKWKSGDLPTHIKDFMTKDVSNSISTSGFSAPQMADFDSDGDGLTDACEKALKTDPLKADTDGDGMLDGQEDASHDCITNNQETDPLKADAKLFYPIVNLKKPPKQLGTGVLSKPSDSDNDGIPDSTDNCPNKANPNQKDLNKNRIGDVCEGAK